MLRFLLSLTGLAALCLSATAQEVLDMYVRQALDQHPRLREQRHLEASAQAALAGARSQFGPTLSFGTTYTLAGGGRAVELPLGTLLNDVYSTLTDITGQSFPQVRDETFTFLPNNFYDARFRITQPVIQPRLRLNREIKTEEVTLSQLETNRLRRDIILDTKTAYLRWMQAREAVGIYDQGLSLLQENQRVTERLVANGMAIPSAALRIRADIDQLQAQRTRALTDQANAAAHVNLLLGRDPDAELLPSTFPVVPDIPAALSIEQREELRQLETGQRMQDLAGELERKAMAPTLNVQLDVGSQNFIPDWGGYYLGAVALEVPLFDNSRSRLKAKEWAARSSASTAGLEWARDAFMTELRTETESLRADIAVYENYASLLASNERYYAETLRRYQEGLTGYIELLDARTQVTRTQLEQNIARYQAWIRRVRIERLTAGASID